jgi:putative MFS transporter
VFVTLGQKHFPPKFRRVKTCALAVVQIFKNLLKSWQRRRASAENAAQNHFRSRCFGNGCDKWHYVWKRAVLFAALGYFVDIYDLVLFSVLRVSSLKSLGVPPTEWMSVGIRLMNWQMAGLLLGGLTWGVLADKRGRLSTLLTSIFIYSVANIVNAFVFDLQTYAWVRFIAGFGLAGELGTAITLVSEVLPAAKRGYGTTLVAAIGFCGAVAAALVGDRLDWRTGYFIGGVMGLLLLLVRKGLSESEMYLTLAAPPQSRGSLTLFFLSRERMTKIMSCVLLGVPIWLVAGLLTPFSPEICKQLGVTGLVNVGTAVLLGYAGASVGDLLSGFLSQRLKSRKLIIALFTALLLVTVFYFLSSRGWSPVQFYALWFWLGLMGGYWAVLVGFICEQFGTNLRATATTAIPNFIRATVVPLNFLVAALTPKVGLIRALVVVTAGISVVCLFSLIRLPETFGRQLNFLEK